MSEKNENPGGEFLTIIEQFTEFIKEKSETDDEVKDIVPMLEGLTSHVKEAIKFQEDYPSIAGMLTNLCATQEEHHRKLEMLKDIVVDSGLANVERPMTKDEMAEEILKNMPKPDGGYMN